MHLSLGVLIREQDPLKQGLKHLCIHVLRAEQHIREQDPLKQGLKRDGDNRSSSGIHAGFVSKIH